MAKNYYQDGTTMDWSNSTGADYKSGDPVPVGEITGVAHGDIPNGAAGVLHVMGVWVLPKNTGDAWDRGDKVYLIPDTGLVTNVPDDGAATPTPYPVAGTAWVTVGAADVECRVRLGF
jgi:predicted RecA/RadA family phage recombinase